jgi:hypothetical protein
MVFFRVSAGMPAYCRMGIKIMNRHPHTVCFRAQIFDFSTVPAIPVVPRAKFIALKHLLGNSAEVVSTRPVYRPVSCYGSRGGESP